MSWNLNSSRKPRALRRKNSNRQGYECVPGSSTQRKAASPSHHWKGQNGLTRALGCDPLKRQRASEQKGRQHSAVGWAKAWGRPGIEPNFTAYQQGF